MGRTAASLAPDQLERSVALDVRIRVLGVSFDPDLVEQVVGP